MLVNSRWKSVVLSVTVGLSSGLSSAVAGDAAVQKTVVQKFDNWTVTIQPGARIGELQIPPAPLPATPFRPISQTDANPVEQDAKAPDEPAPPATPETVTIVPESAPPTGTVAAANTATAPIRTVDPLALVQLYPQVYNTIPFSRAEYQANPSYRHDATMEFLFGQLRQTVIQRGHTTVSHESPAMYAPSPVYSPYGFNSYFYPFYTNYVRPYSLW